MNGDSVGMRSNLWELACSAMAACSRRFYLTPHNQTVGAGLLAKAAFTTISLLNSTSIAAVTAT